MIQVLFVGLMGNLGFNTNCIDCDMRSVQDENNSRYAVTESKGHCDAVKLLNEDLFRRNNARYLG